MATDSLFLHEEVLLLALRDKEGTLAPGTMCGVALGGAFLAELLLAGRVRIQESGKQKLIEVVNSQPIGEPILDQCLEMVAKASRRANPAMWVRRFMAIKGGLRRATERLCACGILRASTGKVLGIFTRDTYPEVNPEPERRLIARLHRVIFSDSGAVEERTSVLVSLAYRAGLLKVVFDKKQLATRKPRIEQISRGEMAGDAVKGAVESMVDDATMCIVTTMLST